MAIKIIALAIGILLAVAGVFYLVKEKEDPESRRIYTIATIVGIAVAVVSAVLLFK